MTYNNAQGNISAFNKLKVTEGNNNRLLNILLILLIPQAIRRFILITKYLI
jgi:hypothetical protein